MKNKYWSTEDIIGFFVSGLMIGLMIGLLIGAHVMS